MLIRADAGVSPGRQQVSKFCRATIDGLETPLSGISSKIMQARQRMKVGIADAFSACVVAT